MLALKIIGVIILIFVLIGQIRVGIDFKVFDRSVTLFATVLGARLQLIPKKKKPKAEKPAESEKPKDEEPQKEKPPKKAKKRKKKKWLELRIDIYDIREMLGKVSRGLKKFGRGFNLKKLVIDFAAASPDPYFTARLYSVFNAFFSCLCAIIDERNCCEDLYIRSYPDYQADLPSGDIELAVTFRIGAAFGMVFSILFGILWVFIKIFFRFLIMKLFDKEEYEFRTREQLSLMNLIISLKNKKKNNEKKVA